MTDQIFFLGKVLLLSTVISVSIKYGLPWLLSFANYSIYFALSIIFLPVIILTIILFLRQKKMFID